MMGERYATDELVRDITRRIVEFCRPEKVVLFGSLARGEAKDHSDIDLFVIWDAAPDLSNRQRRVAIRRAIGALRAPLDLLTLTPSEVEEATKDPRSFTSQIMQEGRTLYERFH